jgi:hypothetical protein
MQAFFTSGPKKSCSGCWNKGTKLVLLHPFTDNMRSPTCTQPVLTKNKNEYHIIIYNYTGKLLEKKEISYESYLSVGPPGSI